MADKVKSVMGRFSQMQVFEQLSEERSFQEASGRGIYVDPHTVQEWCAIADEYLGQASDLAHEGNLVAAMGFLRRVGAICVAAIEQHGTPARGGGGTYES